MKAKKVLYWFGGVLGVILLGAIANGVWSGILSPALSWFVDIVIRSFSLISVSFKNNIYQEAAKGFHEAPSLENFFICLAVFFATIWAFSSVIFSQISKRLTTEEASKEDLLKLKRKLNRDRITVSILLLTFFLMFLWSLLKLQYANRIITQSLNSVEIISPFIEQKEYLSLKSDFYRVKNAEDYEAYYKKMVDLSDEHEIELPLFKPL